MANGDDYTVGVAQAASPDRYVDNEQHTNSAGTTVARQKVSAPRTDMLLSAIVRTLSRLGLTVDTSARQRVSVENIAAGTTLPTVTTVTTVSGVTTVTTVSTVTNLAQLGGLTATLVAVNQINAGAAANRGRIAVT